MAKKVQVFCVLVLLVLFSAFSYSLSSEQKISSGVMANSRAKDKIDVIIKFREPSSLETQHFEELDPKNRTLFRIKEVSRYREGILKTLDNSSIKIKNKFNLSNTISASMSSAMLDGLRRNPYVEWVHEEITFTSFLDVSAPLVSAPAFWNTYIEGLPVNGTGETACIIDTGIDYRHDAFGDCTISYNLYSGSNTSYSVESLHPYATSTDYYFKVNKTGFDQIAVHFKNITTELEWDLIKILDPNTGNSTVAVYTGTHNNVWSPSVEGDTLFIKLESDGSYTDWGFEVDYILNGSHDTVVNWSFCDKVIDGWDLAAPVTSMDDMDPMDDQGHGTHVAGIVASQDPLYRGMAPGAKLVAMKAMNQNRKGNVTDVLASMEYCIENQAKHNVSVMVMSLGSGTYAGYCDTNNALFELFSDIVEQAIDAGILVVAASGNDAATGIAFPSCLQNVTSVGASTKADSIDESYSNTASILDLVAPGTDIMSAEYNADTFTLSDGTSMAAPHVAGAAILMRNFKRLENGTILEPLQIRQILMQTGDNLTDSRTGLNFSRINLTKAFSAIDDRPRLVFVSGNITGNYSRNSIFFNITTSEPVNATLSFGSQNYSMDGSSGNYHYNLTNLTSGIKNFSVFIVDSTGNMNISKSFNITVDALSPSWSAVSFFPQTNASYNRTGRYQFNTTWDDDSISSVVIEHNFSSVMLNYTVTNNSTNVYYYNHTGIAAGSYSWRMHAHDSLGNKNTTSWQNYTVIKANSSILLNLNRSASNLTWERGIPLLLNATALFGEAEIELFDDSGLLTASLNPMVNTTFYTLGLKNITARHNESANYTVSNITYAVNVTDTLPPQVNLSRLNNSLINQSYLVDFNFTLNENSSCAVIYNTTTNYTNLRFIRYNISLYEVSYKNLTINCTDLSGFSTLQTYNFSFNDSAKPVLSSLSETPSYTSFTLSFASDEPVNATATITGQQKTSATYTTSKEFTFSSLSETTAYSYSILACDRLGNCNTISDSVTTLTQSSDDDPGGSTSPGGSTVAGTSTTADTDEVKMFFYNPEKGIHELDIDKEDIPLSKIEFSLKNDFSSSISLAVKKANGSDVEEELDQPVYSYIKITKQFFEDSNLSAVELHFELPESWLEEHNFTIDEIYMYRYSEGWTKLQTELQEASAGSYSFKAVSPGFSFFAVSGEKEQPEPVLLVVEDTPIPLQLPENASYETKTTTLPEPPDKKFPITMLILSLVLGLIAGASIYAVYYFKFSQHKSK